MGESGTGGGGYVVEHSEQGSMPQAGARERPTGPNHTGLSSPEKELASDPKCSEVFVPHKGQTGKSKLGMERPQGEVATACLTMLFSARPNSSMAHPLGSPNDSLFPER